MMSSGDTHGAADPAKFGSAVISVEVMMPFQSLPPSL
jgi:hypothetical protein